MFSLTHPLLPVLAAIVLCLALQLGFAVGVFGPAWLSPVLSLPALGLITWLWRRAERENQSTRAFTELVI
ncbi:MAG: hypothetical protein NXH88_12035 [Hyphomonas sp.]|nr:hypothetical protein [Hyphomonas sp.]